MMSSRASNMNRGRVSGRARFQKPQFEEPLTDHTFAPGDRVVLKCRVDGHPPPEITWRKDSRLITNTKNVRVQKDGDWNSLELVCAHESDAGTFSVIASNMAGQATTTGRLTVGEGFKDQDHPPQPVSHQHSSSLNVSREQRNSSGNVSRELDSTPNGGSVNRKSSYTTTVQLSVGSNSEADSQSSPSGNSFNQVEFTIDKGQLLMTTPEAEDEPDLDTFKPMSPVHARVKKMDSDSDDENDRQQQTNARSRLASNTYTVANRDTYMFFGKAEDLPKTQRQEITDNTAKLEEAVNHLKSALVIPVMKYKSNADNLRESSQGQFKQFETTIQLPTATSGPFSFKKENIQIQRVQPVQITSQFSTTSSTDSSVEKEVDAGSGESVTTAPRARIRPGQTSKTSIILDPNTPISGSKHTDKAAQNSKESPTEPTVPRLPSPRPGLTIGGGNKMSSKGHGESARSRPDKKPSFIIKPRRNLVDEGQVAKFKASIDGHPAPSVVWTRNGADIEQGAKYRLYEDEDFHWLEVLDCRTEDKGTYTCTISNHVDTVSVSTELDVYVRRSTTNMAAMRQRSRVQQSAPRVDKQMTDVVAMDGESATFECQISGTPQPTVTWMFGGEVLKLKGIRQSYDGKVAKLIFTEVFPDDEGTYECVATNTGGEARTAAKLAVRLPGPSPPNIVRHLENTTADDGAPSMFECEVSGTPPLAIVWMKGSQEIPPSQDFHPSVQGRVVRLNIQEVYPEDEGDYCCVVKNEAGVATSTAHLSVRLPQNTVTEITPPPVPQKVVVEAQQKVQQVQQVQQVQVPQVQQVHQVHHTPQQPAMAQERPSFIKPLSDLELNVGERLELAVQVSGSQPLDVVWLHGETEITRDSREFQISSKGSSHKLVKDRVEPHHAGLFICEAYNQAGDEETSCQLTIKEPGTQRLNGDSRLPQQSFSAHSSDAPSTTSSQSHHEQEVASDDEEYAPEIAKNPKSCHVEEGNAAAFSCRICANPLPRVWWQKDGVDLEPGERFKFSEEGDVYQFEIPHTLVTDAGRYQVLAKNKYGTVKFSVSLMVKKIEIIDTDFRSVLKARPTQKRKFSTEAEQKDFRTVLKQHVDTRQRPVIDKELKDLRAKEGASAVLECRVMGIPTPEIKWYHGKKEIKGSQFFKMTYDNEVARLVIAEVYPEDEGNYTCEASNEAGSARSTCEISLRELGEKNKEEVKLVSAVTEEEVQQVDFRGEALVRHVVAREKPEIKKHLKDQRVKEGDNFKLECRMTGIPPPTITWSHNKKDVLVSDFIQLTFEDGCARLLISEACPDDEGEYSCQATNEAGSVVSTCDVQIMYAGGPERRFEQKDPAKNKTLPKDAEQVDFRNVLSRTGSTLERKQKGGGEQVDFRNVLSKKVESKKGDKPVAGEQVDFRNALNNPTKTKVGVKHVVEQKDFREMLTKKVETKQRPQVQKELKDGRSSAGEKFTLECRITGTPAPKITWYHDKKEIKESKYFHMSYENEIARLVVDEIYPEDQGVYWCRAINDAGIAQSTCDVHVTAVELPARASSLSPTQADAADLTEPPLIEELEPGNQSVVRGVSFQLTGKFVGAPAPQVMWFKDKEELQPGEGVQISVVRDTTILTITESEPCHSGKYTLCIENELGKDVMSASVTVEDRPDAPGSPPHASNLTETSLTLSWYGPGYDGGSTVTDYRVEMCLAETDQWKALTSSCKSTSYDVKNLQTNQAYIFRISAGNKHGFSDPGPVSTPLIPIDRRLSSHSEPISPLASPFSPAVLMSEFPFEPKTIQIQAGRKFSDVYDTAEEIGKGKFGSVYLCREKTYGRQFAAKFIKSKLSQKDMTRQEIAIMNELHHPKLLQLWDAFEGTRDMVLVLEHIAGGELFERIVDEDYVLTERECVHFMRQIGEAVRFMHEHNILHLDLKPENILCITKNSNEIKVIDFGLARKFDPSKSDRVLFGTPEFVAPEVVNFEQIGYTTDMWSIGVICYTLLSGLSPFMGDSPDETLSNVTGAHWDFEDDAFDEISDDAKDFISAILVKNPRKRMKADESLKHKWLSQDVKYMRAKRLSTAKHKRFLARRKWQKTGNAIRAIGRMASMQKSLLGLSGSRSVSQSSDSASDTVSVHSRSRANGGNSSEGTTPTQVAPPVSARSRHAIPEIKEEPQPPLPSQPPPDVPTRQTSREEGRAVRSRRNVAEPEEEETPALPRQPPPSRPAADGATSLRSRFTRSRTATSDDMPASPTKEVKSESASLSFEKEASPPPPAKPQIARLKRAESSETESRPSLRGLQALTSFNSEQSDTPVSSIRTRQTVDTPKTVTRDANYNKTETVTTTTTRTVTKPEPVITGTKSWQPSAEKESQNSKLSAEPLAKKDERTQDDDEEEEEDGEPQHPDAPCFLTEMADCSVLKGDVARFDVRLKGKPTPEVQWLLDDKPIEESPRHKISQTPDGRCSLIIKNCTKADAGEMECYAKNSNGEDSCFADLYVSSVGIQ